MRPKDAESFFDLSTDCRFIKPCSETMCMNMTCDKELIHNYAMLSSILDDDQNISEFRKC
jgi:hypothetical protein